MMNFIFICLKYGIILNKKWNGLYIKNNIKISIQISCLKYLTLYENKLDDHIFRIKSLKHRKHWESTIFY